MQASDRARNTEQHRRMSRKELKVGLAKVCTTAWVSTLHGEVNDRRCKNVYKHFHEDTSKT